jgi:hypothetical protein
MTHFHLLQTIFIIMVFNAASVERVERALHWSVKHAPGGSERVVAKVLALFDKARDKFSEDPGSNGPSIPRPKVVPPPVSGTFTDLGMTMRTFGG